MIRWDSFVLDRVCRWLEARNILGYPGSNIKKLSNVGLAYSSVAPTQWSVASETIISALEFKLFLLERNNI